MKLVLPTEIDGQVPAPPSKSQMQRAVAIGSLSEAPLTITNPDFSDDSQSAMSVVEGLGAKVERQFGGPEANVRITPGAGLAQHTLNCGQSGLCMRLFPSIAALQDKPFTFTATGGLNTRPVGMLSDALSQLGAESHCKNGLPPLSVQGPLRGGNAVMDASVSSQPLSGLLLALPKAQADSHVEARGLESKPYVRMTMQLAAKFGVEIGHSENLDAFDIPARQQYRGGSYEVEGDWSGASFLLVAGAVAGRMAVEGLDADSLQADRAILDALRLAGANVKDGPNSTRVERGELQAFEFDLTQCPDLAPPLVVLAAYCPGTSILRGTRRLRFKESDRAAVLKEEFAHLGVRVETEENEMRIFGGAVRGGEVDSNGDHRIAMSAAVAALGSQEGVRIKNAACVSKSFPSFFERLEEARA
ncbi:3-phosphoshikimate 1-carboxyvinyltransferase [uncultured archaeon]|nr:3-phosphoshikimate 1-carboxyvinyltransferase [uncultured archaeon]